MGKTLEELLLADDDEDVRAWAEAALKQKPVQTLASRAHQPQQQPPPRQQQGYGSSAADLLDDEDDEVRAWAAAALGRTGQAALARGRTPPSSMQSPGRSSTHWQDRLQAPAAAAAPTWQHQPHALRPQQQYGGAAGLLADDDEEVRAWAEAALGQSRAQAALAVPAAAQPQPSSSGRSPRPRLESRGAVVRAADLGSSMRSSQQELANAASSVYELPADSPEDEASNVISVCVRLRGLNAAERPGGLAWKTEGGLIWEAEAEVCNPLAR